MIDCFIPLVAGILLDHILGEPRKFHPLVGFGLYARFVEKTLNCIITPRRAKFSGGIAWLLVVAPPILLLVVALSFQYATPVIEALILYFCIGRKSLQEHALHIYEALKTHDLQGAQQATARIVSRETHCLDFNGLRKATVESILENGPDAILAPVLWFLVLGAPGALLYRLANTLDAMWGYRTEQYRYFGYAAAKIDDILNWIPARLVALSYSALGNWPQGIKAWRQQAPLCNSPNAGPVMAAGAGSLGIQLGGSATYSGQVIPKPVLGFGSPPTNNDLLRAVHLVSKTLLLWCVLVLITLVVHYVFF